MDKYSKKSVDSGGLKSGEETAASGAKGIVGKAEKGLIGNGLNVADKFMPPEALAAKLVKSFFTKKRTTAGTIAIVIVGVIIYVFSFMQGPLQIIHFAKLLQKFHLKSEEDFGDGRSTRQIIYAIDGETERGRLGRVNTKLADEWERRMIQDAGLRPLYHAQTGRLIGFEVMSGDKDALKKALDNNSELKTAYEKGLANGARLRSGQDVINEAIARPTNRSGDVPPINKNHQIIDFQNETGFKQTRLFTRAIGRVVVAPGVPSAVGSRLLEKRGGVSFHFFNKAKKKIDSRASADIQKKQSEDFEKSVLVRFAQNIKTGVKAGNGANKESQDLIDEINAAEAEGKSPEEVEKIKIDALKGAKGPLIVLGVVCGAKDVGNAAQDAKYYNNLLPMMRIGWLIMSAGDQARSGHSISLDELGVISKRLHDKKKGNSWINDPGVRYEMGKSATGPPLPAEAQLGKIGDKGDIFEVLDLLMSAQILPFVTVGTACSGLNTVANLPGISHVSSAIQTVIDTLVLKPIFGASTDELVGKLIGVISGKGVNPLAKGAELGGLANIGMRLAANDHFLSMGGDKLPKSVAQQQRQDRVAADKEQRANESFLTRYFDVYDGESLAGGLIDRAPPSASQLASSLNPFNLIQTSISSAVSTFGPKALAAEVYDYGVEEYGYTQRDQDDDMFENPYENARIIEDEANGGQRLKDLNEKYSVCFSMGVTYDDKGVHLQNGQSVNVFELEKGATLGLPEVPSGPSISIPGAEATDNKYKECRAVRDLPDNHPDKVMYKRYRFYLADAQIALSLACYEGAPEDAETIAACAELDPGSATSSAAPGDTDSGGATVSSDAKESAQKLLDLESDGKIIFGDYSEASASDRADKSLASQQIQDIAAGRPAKGTTRCGFTVPANITPDPKILQFLVDLGQNYKYTINSLFGQCHSGPGSNHYEGKAVDFGCPFDTAKGDAAGPAYGVSRNGENCSGDGHYHYSVGGN